MPPIPAGTIYNAAFPSVYSELILARGDSIYTTTDDGNGWRLSSLNIGANSGILTIGFLNPDTGYIAGPTDEMNFSSPTMIGWTYDGGATWSVDSTKSIEGFLNGAVLFTSRERGFATKWNTPAIFETSDGGITWSADTLANNIPPSDISSADGKTIIVTGAGGEIIVSKDSGATWQDLTPAKKIQFTFVKYISGDLLTAIGDGYELFVSNDSGKTWTTRQLPSGLNDVIAFGDTTNCWIGDDSSRIYHSTDLGLSWTFQNPQNVPAPPLYAISFMNDSIGCAVGFDGFITASSNGGSTWGIEPSVTSHNLYGVFVASRARTWAVGDSGTIITTSNGFNSWSSQTSPVNAALRSVSFSDTLDGYILGDNGIILKTTDGGKNWTLDQSPSSSLNAMKFVSASSGWVGGDGGKMFNTTNGGTSWSSQNSGISANILSLDFLNNYNGIAIGEGGIVLITRNGGLTAVRPPNGSLPATLTLSQNFPNPFNPSTIIAFSVPQSLSRAHVEVSVYNALAQLVKKIFSDNLPAGNYTARWDGTDSRGTSVASGVYFCRVTAGAMVATRKMVLLK